MIYFLGLVTMNLSVFYVASCFSYHDSASVVCCMLYVVFSHHDPAGAVYMNIALCRFLRNHDNIATEGIEGIIVQSTIGSLEHCICTTTMTNIRLDRDSNLVPPGYKPQSIRMSHRGRPAGVVRRISCFITMCIVVCFQLP